MYAIKNWVLGNLAATSYCGIGCWEDYVDGVLGDVG